MLNPRKTFAERLILLRTNSKLGQDKLGKEIGLSRSAISGYENQDRFPSPEILCSIADYFGVSVDYLLGRDNNVLTKYASMLKINPKDAKTIKLALVKIEHIIDSSLE